MERAYLGHSLFTLSCRVVVDEQHQDDVNIFFSASIPPIGLIGPQEFHVSSSQLLSYHHLISTSMRPACYQTTIIILEKGSDSYVFERNPKLSPSIFFKGYDQQTAGLF